MSRRRYVWDETAKALVEVSPDWEPPPRLELVVDSYYEGLRATDGTPIDSRRKHQEYMRRNDLTIDSDYKETWAKAKAKREAAARGEPFDVKRRREAIGRAMYEVESRRRRGR